MEHTRASNDWLNERLILKLSIWEMFPIKEALFLGLLRI